MDHPAPSPHFTAPSPDSLCPPTGQAAAFPPYQQQRISLTENYISMPRRLITDLRDNPLAIALYFLIARLYLIYQAPIPLSRGDIQIYDSSAKTGAIKRALDRLIAAGWLIETSGPKSSYTPTWGLSRTGTARPQIIGEARLACPWDIWKTNIRIDRGLLDLFIGKFTPHARLSAEVSGYFVDADGRHTALLQLKDIGIYIIAVAGYSITATKALTAWDLVRHQQVQTIPDDTVLLALASQRASASSFQLAAAAWRLLGWFGALPLQSAEPAPAPLIFVAKEQIGPLIPTLIGAPIGHPSKNDQAFTSSECLQTDLPVLSPTMQGIQTNLQDSSEPPPALPAAVGGFAYSEKKKTLIPEEEPEQGQLLRAFGVHDSGSLRELSTIALPQITAAITYAKSEQLGPGWVVTTLRRYRDMGQPIPAVHGQAVITWSEVASQYGDLFRHGDDLTDLNVQKHAMPSDTDVTAEIQASLLMHCGRAHQRMISGIRVQVTEQATIVHCQTLADRMTMLNTCMTVLRRIAADLGLPATIQVVSAVRSVSHG